MKKELTKLEAVKKDIEKLETLKQDLAKMDKGGVLQIQTLKDELTLIKNGLILLAVVVIVLILVTRN